MIGITKANSSKDKKKLIFFKKKYTPEVFPK